MKTVIFVVLLVASALAGGSEPLSLTLGRTSYGNNEAYTILCAGGAGAGPWTYRVDGLPSGAYLQGDKIVISSSTVLGTYQLRITATDSTGASIQRNVSLNVVSSGSSSSVIGSSGLANSVIGLGGIAGLTGSEGSLSWNSGATTGTTSGSITWSSTSTGTTTTSGSYPSAGLPSGGSPSGTGGSPSGSGTSPSSGSPSGGSPSGGSPSGGSPSGGSPSGPGRLDGILSNYGGPTSTPSLNYPGNRYPEPNYPTGTSPSGGYNPTPGQIGNSQTPPTSGNRNPITPDDVILRAASERHQNAIKGITNLLKIIDQAKSNKNQAELDINTPTITTTQSQIKGNLKTMYMMQN